MNILTVEHIKKSFGEKVLFDTISFHIAENQRIGLIGVNGTGKSTLLKILAGIEEADQGEIIHSNHFRVEYLPQNPEFDGDSTVLEQVFYGDTPLMQALREYEVSLEELQQDQENEHKLQRLLRAQQQMDATNAWDANTKAKTILTKLGITQFGQKVGELSGGQRKRVAMARALIQPADLLILDEPTNHIDNETVEWLEEYLSSFKGALLLVTHDRYFLDRVTNRIFELDNGKLYSYEGNYASFLEKKAEREENELAQESKRQNLLRRELAWLRRGAKARTTKQKARVQRAEELRDKKVEGPQAKLDIALGASRLGKKVIEAEKVSKAFGERILLTDFSYIVVPGDRIGIIGPNGSGKSTLLNMLAGRIQPDSGTIETGETVKLAFYTQENVEMDGNLRVIEYIKEVAEQIKTADGFTLSASQMLERFLFTPNQQWTYISKLSGGERRRLYLLRTLMGEPNVLFLDEPTNDLDIQTLSILEDYLDHFPGAVITVSHDRYFLDRTVEHLFAFEGQGRIRHYMGNYSEYLDESKQEKASAEKAAKEKANEQKSDQSSAQATRGGNRTKKLSYKDKRDWDEIEDRIADLEEKLSEIKNQVANAGSNVERAQELFAQEQEIANQLEQAMERWTELSIMVEELEEANKRG
ncbi:ABC-F family ATP-binding cassette domain-containing protein [Brevibacillus laterosporus]|uniref:ABC-F family ATP-binding cassette domain-containing protein n=1 Tax=Brevibacillus laterosporus TaxID=1465 RepID=UPI00264C20D6|nr:ABC-F family ATP-binding cassette domain-containing protein [Brevibacillus laterosporus]MDN9010299.1 ABC-F family ATP-binding cassette domain-containing protein [Brevibacillus laterosporus]MDO0941186.1 ABC-F family ATP-binding cassette domain-containing protein [Brevibacillus laterosporus]